MAADNLVSIIIPAFNAQDFIARSIGCATAQTHGNVQVVVVDDGSTDSTAEIAAALAARDERICLVSHERNLGRLEARRLGIQTARGAFTLFLDADDEILPDMVERLLTEQNGRFDIVQCDFEVRYDGYASAEERAFNRAFNRPPALTAEGDDITHLVFRERRTTWSLCGKLMRTSIVKEAIGHIRASSLTQAEDACLFFIISCLARTYKGVPGFAGYIYNIDAGASDARWKTMDARQFSYTCRYVDAMDLIHDFLIDTDRLDALAEDYRTVRYEHARAVADKLIHVVNAEDKPAAFAEFVRLWPVTEAVAGMSEAGWGEGADCMGAIASSSALTCGPHPIRTVAAFNYQMHVGGAERVAATLARTWCEQGLRVVFLSEEPRSQCAYDLPDEVIWVELPSTESSGPGCYEKRARAIEQAVSAYAIDAFVHHQWWNDLIAWDMLLLKSLGVPFCLLCHNLFEVMLLEANEGDFDCTRLFRYVDGLVVLSRTDERFWRRFVPRVWRTCNPATIAPDPAHTAALEGKNVVWVGRLTAPDKQPAEALHIMARAMGADPELSLTVVGASDNPRDERALKALARRLGIAERVEFVGTQQDVRPFYERASMMLLTSRHESWCLALGEAKACGLPVVMYELGHLALAEGNRGIMSVPQGDRDGAARAVLELVGDEERRRALGREAYLHASELSTFDLGVFWNGVFGELAQGSPKRIGFDEDDAEWDLVIDGIKQSVRKASNPRIRSFAKRKGLDAARHLWHRIRRR